MKFDVKVPLELKKAQTWFGSIISRPIDVNSNMAPISPSGRPMEQEACDFINPSPTLRPAQRVQLYNQQYWWRLLKTMQDAYPTVTRLFGYYDFNESLAVPFLVKYCPNHWSLNNLGDRFPQWVKEDYTQDNHELVYNAACIDCGYNTSFFAPDEPPLASPQQLEEGLESLFEVPLTFQKHISLYQFPYHLFQFRDQFLLQEPEYWVDNDFPVLQHAEGQQKYSFVLFRDALNQIIYKQIDTIEYDLLKRFENGETLNGLCEWLEKQVTDETILTEAMSNLHIWLQRWIGFCWLKRN